MIFVPLLHYFLCKNDYSGNEAGLRYRLTPGKRTVPDPDGEAVYRFSGAGEFTVTAQPGTVTVTVGGGEAEQTLTFRQFIPPQEGGGGS